MARTKLLRGLPNSLIESYFSTLCYWKKGYMAEWIYYGATSLNIEEITINILDEIVVPEKLNIMPLRHYLSNLRSTIKRTLDSNGFDEKFIQSATLLITIKNGEKLMDCVCEVTDINNVTYKSKIYNEKVYEPYFDVLKECNI